MLASLKVVVSPYVCELPRFVRWRRNHRRSRINRKWHKRYGSITTHCPGVAYECMNQLILCPHAKEAMDREAEKVKFGPVMKLPPLPGAFWL